METDNQRANQKVLVTGGEGRIGQVVVEDLLEHGYQVTSVDKNAGQKWRTKIVDCEDLGQVVSIMHGHDAVIHLAAIPTPNRHTAEVVFRNNVMSTFNILEAASLLGIKNVVLASSISALGTAYMFQHTNPRYVPIDEEHPLLSQDAYGLSKMVGEELAAGYTRRTPDISVKSLRFTTVSDERLAEMFFRPQRSEQAAGRHFFNAFWTFVDIRDTAAACRLALAYTVPGHQAFFIAAPVIYLDIPVEELLARYFPGDYPIAEHIRGKTSPVDCSKAENLLDWKARYNWDGTDL